MPGSLIVATDLVFDWRMTKDPSLMFHWLNRKYGRPFDQRRLRLFLAACCRHHPRPLSGDLNAAALEWIEQAADATSPMQTQAALSAVRDMDRDDIPGMVFRNYPRGNVANMVAWAAMPDAADGVQELLQCQAARRGTLLARQACCFVRDIAGDPDAAPPVFDPAWACWNAGAAVLMADAIYRDRDFGLLPLLADMLEEAECSEAEILTHCRQRVEVECPCRTGRPGGAAWSQDDLPTAAAACRECGGFPRRTVPHVRGCWVVDGVRALRKDG